MRYKIESYSQFQKDSESKAILNVDKNALSAYKAQRTNIKKAMDVSNEIENLKLDVQEIKLLLYQLLNNR